MRGWRLAVVTGLLGFLIAAVVLTVPELVAGRSASDGARDTTIFGGGGKDRESSAPATTHDQDDHRADQDRHHPARQDRDRAAAEDRHDPAGDHSADHDHAADDGAHATRRADDRHAARRPAAGLIERPRPRGGRLDLAVHQHGDDMASTWLAS